MFQILPSLGDSVYLMIAPQIHRIRQCSLQPNRKEYANNTI